MRRIRISNPVRVTAVPPHLPRRFPDGRGGAGVVSSALTNLEPKGRMGAEPKDGLAVLAGRRGDVVETYLKLLGQLGSALEPKTKQLILLTLQTTQGSARALRRHVPRAMAAGATVEEVVDAISLALPVAGLTRVTEALGAVADLLEAAEETASTAAAAAD
jgi:alkylhydroperoxidase/carboxymuconolactone decarboxylase family protein YurZ